jgi:hypothetical protein
MALSEQRQREIKRLVYEGGEELSAATALGEQATDAHLKRMHQEIWHFLTTSANAEELDFFAENWMRDGREGPIHQLIENPFVDAGTLLRLYRYSDPEFYRSRWRSPAEVQNEADRDVFTTVERIERRFTTHDYKTAAIPFDPEEYVTMADRYPEFPRPIPSAMFEPIGS